MNLIAVNSREGLGCRNEFLRAKRFAKVTSCLMKLHDRFAENPGFP